MTQLNSEQQRQCHFIIHSAAAAAAMGNTAPLPGSGLVADSVAVGAMAMRLASVLGADCNATVVKAMAKATLLRELAKQPAKVAMKELLKFIPVVGQASSPLLTIGIIEAVGWSLVAELAKAGQGQITPLPSA